MQLIPRDPWRKTAGELHRELVDNGYLVTKKTVERDLTELSSMFPIRVDDSAKPYQWFWTKNARVDVPGVALSEALSLVLAAETLHGLMHKTLLAPIQERLTAARRMLGDSQRLPVPQHWDRIRSVPRGFRLHAPKISPKVLEGVQEALLCNRQLAIHYQSLQDKDPRWRTVNPRLLLLKGAVMYLIADAFVAGGKAADYPLKQYALHRIAGIRPVTQEAVFRPFNIKSFIRDEEHEVGSRTPIRLRLQVSEDLKKILFETPLAERQRILGPVGQRFVVEAAVRNTPALRQWILGHGKAAIVLSPAALRADIARRIREAAAAY